MNGIGPIANGIPLRVAAKRCRKHVQFLKSLINDGRLAAYATGRRLYVLPEDLERAIRESTRFVPARPARRTTMKLNPAVNCR